MGVSRYWVLFICGVLLLGLSACSSSKIAADLELAVQPKILDVEVNLPTKLTVTLNRKNLDAAAPVRLELENPPASLSAPTLTVTDSTASLLLTASALGSYIVKLKASTGDISKTVSFTVNVQKVMGFGISLTPGQLNLSPSKKGSLNITINRTTLPATTPVRVRLINPPAEISSSPIRINGSTGTLDITASKIGTYDLRVLFLGGEFRKEIPLIVKVGSNTLVKETVASGLEVPWDLNFTPDGTLYFTERIGNIKKVVNGSIVNIIHSLEVWAEKESGLMGLDFSPDYPGQPYVYVCYSYLESAGVIKNRVSQLTLENDSLSDEKILMDAIPGGTNHDGCRIVFAPDKTLYITMGDARVGANAQDTSSLSGKTLRINADGSIPDDNPFGNPVWSYGHRNAQGLAFHRNGKLYSSEHGDADEDEINLITKGKNYGWPFVEGMCNTASEETHCDLQEPIQVFTPTIAVSGIAFYDGDMFPEWKGDLLLASLKAGLLYQIDLDSSGEIISDKIIINNDQGYGRLRDIEVAPDGSIYIAISNRDGRGADPFPTDEDDRIIRWSKQ
jgi:glucose/arabinose dehydrogenase